MQGLMGLLFLLIIATSIIGEISKWLKQIPEYIIVGYFAAIFIGVPLFWIIVCEIIHAILRAIKNRTANSQAEISLHIPYHTETTEKLYSRLRQIKNEVQRPLHLNAAKQLGNEAIAISTELYKRIGEVRRDACSKYSN